MTADAPLTSRWGQSLNDQPLNHYPRPMLERAEWINLNGWWDYAIVGQHNSEAAPLPLASWDGKIRVPFAVESAASGVHKRFTPADTLVYERSIDIPKKWQGRRIAINFEAVDYLARVWIDSTLVTTHTGGYLPFHAEIPDTHQSSVTVRVEVTDPTDTGMQQRGKQALTSATIWYTPTSGIWQSVWMEPLPEHAITRVATRTHEDLKTVSVLVETDGPRESVALSIDAGQSAITAEGTSGIPFDVEIPDAQCWSPANPYLYSMTVRTSTDEARSYFALRTVAISAPEYKAPGSKPRKRAGQGRHVLLNGKPMLINAPLQQGYWPESGMTAPHEDAMVHDLQLLKDMGFNGVRIHAKIEPRRFYTLADRMGLMVVQDAVSGAKAPLGIQLSGVVQALDITSPDRSKLFAMRTGRQDADVRAEFIHDWINTIHHLEVHPCIVMWVPFNEGWGQFDARTLDRITRRTDPTRLVDAASGWFDQGHNCGDFRSRHQYFLKLRKPSQRDPRPYYLSEFGGYNLAVEGHMWPTIAPFGYGFYEDEHALAQALTDLYREQIIPLVEHGLTAITYTQVSDVEQETNGLVTYDREVTKVDPQLMRSLNQELERAFINDHGAP
ncbi:glycoside hydrolase family 2 protein [Schaalia vaccimaxillae]|uniref:glycoside hydrolase family 2 protein n=1 Tax=Schaalia vaccimaxillae TaxID=183916 RepID=UPI0003B3B42E|nr:glycoside hydrolase family 2 [Schaalia vaccimaxillae]